MEIQERHSHKRPKNSVEKHPDGYVAYPIGLKGVIIGQGESYESALADVKSAIQFHLESFGHKSPKIDPSIQEVFIVETQV